MMRRRFALLSLFSLGTLAHGRSPATFTTSASWQLMGGGSMNQPNGSQFWVLGENVGHRPAGHNLDTSDGHRSVGVSMRTGGSGCAAYSTCSGTAYPTRTGGREIHFQSSTYAGTTADQQLSSAENSLKGTADPLVFVMDTPGTFASSVSLAKGNSLRFAASLTFARGASINALGSNLITCDNGVRLLTRTAGASLILGKGDNISVSCDAGGVGGESFVLRTSAGVNGSRVAHMNLSRIGAAYIAGGTGHSFENLTISDPSPGRTSYGYVVTGNASNVSGHDMTATNVNNPVEWFNADADFNKGGPTSRSAVASHGGGYSFSRIHCTNAQACVWGSVAHDIHVSDSDAQNTGDVAFDCEGCIDALFDNVKSLNSSNGGLATFFFADNIVFQNPYVVDDGGHPLMSLHNSSGDKSKNNGTTVTQGTLRCLNVVCSGISSESAQSFNISKNKFIDATITRTSALAFGADQLIADNDFFLTISPSAATSVIQPLDLQGGTAIVARNTIHGAATYPAGSTQLDLYDGDFNTKNQVMLQGNKLLATGVPNDINAVVSTGNAGTGATFSVQGNYTAHNSVSHSAVSGYNTWHEATRYRSNGLAYQLVKNP